MNAKDRAALLPLLNDIAQSEHRLRHQNAFELICKTLGMKTVHVASGSKVVDPKADEAE